MWEIYVTARNVSRYCSWWWRMVFGKCLWSPARNHRGMKWAFWETVVNVKEGDTVLHLRSKGKDAAFVGFSIAASEGHETSENPHEPG